MTHLEGLSHWLDHGDRLTRTAESLGNRITLIAKHSVDALLAGLPPETRKVYRLEDIRFVRARLIEALVERYGLKIDWETSNWNEGEVGVPEMSLHNDIENVLNDLRRIRTYTATDDDMGDITDELDIADQHLETALTFALAAEYEDEEV